MSDRQTAPVRREVRAILSRRGGELLVVRPFADDEAAWDLPGSPLSAHVEPEQALRATCLVTIGVDIPEFTLVSPVRVGQGGETVEYHFGLARLDADAALPLGCAELRWVRRERLALLTFEPAIARLLLGDLLGQLPA
ncbi:MAG: NUDIX hydrolase [Phycisphaerales bacterium]|nr:NUDIX hydrolase [Phycisphaerales bacterium]